MTKEELSLELGVSMPYLEDELDILEAAGLLKKTANAVFADALALLPKVRALNFHTESCYDDNRLLWAILIIAMIEGFTLANKHEPIGMASKLALGGYGRIFGYDNDYRFHHFHGITMRTEKEDGTAWFSAVNYRIIERCQLYSHINFDRTSAAMWDAILSKPANPENPALPELIENGFIHCENDILSASFPIFENAVFETLSELLRPTAEVVSACMIDISDKAAAILAEHAPAAVRDPMPRHCQNPSQTRRYGVSHLKNGGKRTAYRPAEKDKSLYLRRQNNFLTNHDRLTALVGGPFFIRSEIALSVINPSFRAYT